MNDNCRPIKGQNAPHHQLKHRKYLDILGNYYLQGKTGNFSREIKWFASFCLGHLVRKNGLWFEAMQFFLLCLVSSRSASKSIVKLIASDSIQMVWVNVKHPFLLFSLSCCSPTLETSVSPSLLNRQGNVRNFILGVSRQTRNFPAISLSPTRSWNVWSGRLLNTISCLKGRREGKTKVILCLDWEQLFLQSFWGSFCCRLYFVLPPLFAPSVVYEKTFKLPVKPFI